MKVSKETARHYIWGGICDGWHLLETESLSVIEERIPAGGGEVMHFHEKAQQLFYILDGEAMFETEHFWLDRFTGESPFPVGVRDAPRIVVCAEGRGAIESYTSALSTSSPIQKGDVDNFDKAIATNLRGSYLVMSEAANHVVDGGRIIVFSSSVLGKSFPSYGAYIASKAGVEGLTRVLANELGPRKITVNAVAPGPVATELFLNGKSEELIATLGKMAPLGRIGEVEDIVGVVSLLAGREGGWINGQVIRVNGGYT